MESKIVEFELNQMLGIGLTLVVLGIALGYGLEVMNEVRTDGVTQCDSGYLLNTSSGDCCIESSLSAGYNCTIKTGTTAEYNATENAIAGVEKFPSKLPLIATVIVAAIIIGILVRYLYVSR